MPRPKRWPERSRGAAHWRWGATPGSTRWPAPSGCHRCGLFPLPRGTRDLRGDGRRPRGRPEAGQHKGHRQCAEAEDGEHHANPGDPRRSLLRQRRLVDRAGVRLRSTVRVGRRALPKRGRDGRHRCGRRSRVGVGCPVSSASVRRRHPLGYEAVGRRRRWAAARCRLGPEPRLAPTRGARLLDRRVGRHGGRRHSCGKARSGVLAWDRGVPRSRVGAAGERMAMVRTGPLRRRGRLGRTLARRMRRARCPDRRVECRREFFGAGEATRSLPPVTPEQRERRARLLSTPGYDDVSRPRSSGTTRRVMRLADDRPTSLDRVKHIRRRCLPACEIGHVVHGRAAMCLPTPPGVAIEILAERAGFEPAIEFPLRTLSKRVPSATRPPLRTVSAGEGWDGAPSRTPRARGDGTGFRSCHRRLQGRRARPFTSSPVAAPTTKAERNPRAPVP